MLKRSKYIIIVLIINLFLCAYTTRGTSMVVQEVKEDYDTDYNSFNTVKLENKYLTLPCNFELIKNLGYELKDSDKKTIIPSNSFYTMVYVYNENGDKLTLDFVNSSDKDKPISDCDVYELTMDVNNDNTTSINIEINGVKLLTSIDEAKSVLGYPKYVSDKYNNVYTASWSTEKYDRDILLSFIDGVGLIGVHVTVEMPMGVDYYDAYSTDYRHLDSPLNINESELRYSDTIRIFGGLAFITFIIAVIGVIVLIVLYNKSKYMYIDVSDADKEEISNLDTKIEVPDDSYLEEKYKDYL